MQQTKKQLASTELKFCYTVYPQFLGLLKTHKPSDVLVKLWEDECHCGKQRRYVLFFDSNDQFIAWKHLSNSLDLMYCAREIAGIAIACNASSLMVSHNRLNDCLPNNADKILMANLFKICERVSIEILDYLIITPQLYTSYKDWIVQN